MTYDELSAAAVAYADRNDIEVDSNMDVFFHMAEARINRRLKVRQQTHRIYARTIAGQEYYGLPKDYAGMRSIHYNVGGNPGKEKDTVEVQYVAPNEFGNIDNNPNPDKMYYTVMANQIRIYPITSVGSIEIIYYKRVTHLSTTTEEENWLSTDHPDIYLSGLLAEIESFVKNYDAAKLWDDKMSRSIDELEDSDVDERWAGSTLQMRISNG